MKDTLITFETAKLAKHKNFPQRTGKMFDNGKLKKVSLSLGHPSDYKDRFYSAPTQSLLQKWLREVYNIQVIVIPFASDSMDENSNTIYCFFSNNKHFYAFVDKDHKNQYNTYEEALEIGLQEALKLIK
jgi:hypothetical protein